MKMMLRRRREVRDQFFIVSPCRIKQRYLLNIAHRVGILESTSGEIQPHIQSILNLSGRNRLGKGTGPCQTLATFDSCPRRRN